MFILPCALITMDKDIKGQENMYDGLWNRLGQGVWGYDSLLELFNNERGDTNARKTHAFRDPVK